MSEQIALQNNEPEEKSSMDLFEALLAKELAKEGQSTAEPLEPSQPKKPVATARRHKARPLGKRKDTSNETNNEESNNKDNQMLDEVPIRKNSDISKQSLPPAQDDLQPIAVEGSEEEKSSNDLFMALLAKELEKEGGSSDSSTSSQTRKPIIARRPKAVPQTKNDETNKMTEEPTSTSQTQPINVIDKLSPNWDTQMQESWTTKRDALTELKGLISYPSLESGDYSQIASKIVTVMEEEKNMIVIKLAIECVELLSKGLGAGFSSHSRELVEKMLPRMKEKKLGDSIISTLLSIEECSLSFEELVPFLVSSVNSKSPFEKIGSVNCIEVCLSKKTYNKISSVFETITGAIMNASEDGNKDVREASFKCLGRLLWLSGERNFDKYLSKLDKIKLEKVKEFCTSFGEPPKQASLQKPTPATAPSNSISTKPAPAKKPVQKNPPLKRKQEEVVSNNTIPASKKKTVVPSKSKMDLSVRNTVSQEEALSRAEQILPSPTILEMLTSSKWKDRLEAIEQVATFVTGMNKDSLEESADVLVVTLNQKPGWKESNVQVLCKVVEIISNIVENSSTLSTGATATAIEGMLEKLATPKLKEPCMECLSKFSELHSPQFVFEQLYNLTKDHKNPKIAGEALGWISKAIEEFALQSIDVKSLIDFTKICLGNAKPPVKKGASDILCSMRKFMGEGLLNYLNDVKPALLDSIKKEFEKLTGESAPSATRFVRGMKASSSLEGTSDDTGSSSAPITSFDDMLPRTDISTKITSKVLKDMEDQAWKVRLEALETVRSIINDANKRITSNINNLIQALKKRLDDANVKILSVTFELICLISEAVGKEMDKFCVAIIPYMVTKLVHNNKGTRTSTYQALEAIVKNVPFENFIKYMEKAMSNEKGHPDGRKDALQFIDTYLPSMKNKSKDTFQPIVKALINCLQDPKACTRKLAENIVEKIIKSTGAEFIKDNCRDLKPAFKKTILSIVEKYDFGGEPEEAESKHIELRPVATSQKQVFTSSTTLGDIKKQRIEESMEQDEGKIVRKTLAQTSIFREPAAKIESFASPSRIPTTPSTPGKRPISQVKDNVFTTPKKIKFSQKTEQNLLLSPTTLLTPKKSVSQTEKKPTQKFGVEQILAVLSNTKVSNFSTAINAMKTLDALVEIDDVGITVHRESLLSCLASFFEVAFQAVMIGLTGPRICKYMINTMMGLFESRSFAVSVEKKHLYALLDTLLKGLLNEKLFSMEYGEKIVSSLNGLILKILENSSRTTAYSCLISMLEKACLDHESESTSFTKVLIKCINKLTKTLEKTIGIIDIDSVLLSIQNFLINNPPTFFDGKDDMPLRTIKTIIQTLVKLRGTSIRCHLYGLNKIMVSHIEHELNVLSLSSPSASASIRSVLSSPVRSNTTISSAVVPEVEASETDFLKEVCTMIGNKETTKLGLYKLYRFQVQNPEFKLKEYLGTTQFGTIFQDYIVRSVSKIAAHEQAKSVKQPVDSDAFVPFSSSSTFTLNTPPQDERPALRDLNPISIPSSQPSLPSSITQAPIRSKFSIDDYRNELRMRAQQNENVAPGHTQAYNDVASIKERLAQVKQQGSGVAFTKASLDLESIRQKYKMNKDKLPTMLQ